MRNLLALCALTFLCLSLSSITFAGAPNIHGKTWIYENSVCGNGTTFSYFDSVGTKNNSWTLRIGEKTFAQHYKFSGGKCGLEITGDAVTFFGPLSDGTLTLTDRKVDDDHMQSCYISYVVGIPSTTQYSYDLKTGKLILAVVQAPTDPTDHICGNSQRRHIFH